MINIFAQKTNAWKVNLAQRYIVLFDSETVNTSAKTGSKYWRLLLSDSVEEKEKCGKSGHFLLSLRDDFILLLMYFS